MTGIFSNLDDPSKNDKRELFIEIAQKHFNFLCKHSYGNPLIKDSYDWIIGHSVDIEYINEKACRCLILTLLQGSKRVQQDAILISIERTPYDNPEDDIVVDLFLKNKRPDIDIKTLDIRNIQGFFPEHSRAQHAVPLRIHLRLVLHFAI